MSDVKRLPERLQCMVFRVRFPEEAEELKPVSYHPRPVDILCEGGREHAVFYVALLFFHYRWFLQSSQPVGKLK